MRLEFGPNYTKQKTSHRSTVTGVGLFLASLFKPTSLGSSNYHLPTHINYNYISLDPRKLYEQLYNDGYIHTYTMSDYSATLPNSLQQQLNLSHLPQSITHGLNLLTQRHRIFLRHTGLNQSEQQRSIVLHTLLQDTLTPEQYIHPSFFHQTTSINWEYIIQLNTLHQKKSTIARIEPDQHITRSHYLGHDHQPKYSPSHALYLLQQHYIGLSSSLFPNKESGNNRSSNRTSLVNINQSSIDGVIELLNYVRTQQNIDIQPEYITGGTELGIHHKGIKSHEHGRKLDLRISPLMIALMKQFSINEPNKQYHIQTEHYKYIIEYHQGSERHLDITFIKK